MVVPSGDLYELKFNKVNFLKARHATISPDHREAVLRIFVPRITELMKIDYFASTRKARKEKHPLDRSRIPYFVSRKKIEKIVQSLVMKSAQDKDNPHKKITHREYIFLIVSTIEIATPCVMEVLEALEESLMD
jgi:hypothetical protein